MNYYIVIAFINIYNKWIKNTRKVGVQLLRLTSSSYWFSCTKKSEVISISFLILIWPSTLPCFKLQLLAIISITVNVTANSLQLFFFTYCNRTSLGLLDSLSHSDMDPASGSIALCQMVLHSCSFPGNAAKKHVQLKHLYCMWTVWYELETVYLFDDFLGSGSSAISERVASAETSWIAIACELHLGDDFVGWTVQASHWFWNTMRRLQLLILVFPCLHRWWMVVCYETANCISIHQFNLDLFRFPSFLLLKNNHQIVCWLQEGSWNMVPDYNNVSRQIWVYSSHLNVWKHTLFSCITYSVWVGSPRGDK